MNDFTRVKNYLDRGNRLKVWPAKRSAQILVAEYLAGNFVLGVQYSEKEVNAILSDVHTFNDVALLRRALYDYGFLNRTADCSRYWKVEKVEVV